MALVGVADHGEERQVTVLAVDPPVGIEYLVSAVFGVRLREHHQLDVARVARQPGIGLGQVFDLGMAQGQSHALVGLLECVHGVRSQRDVFQRGGGGVVKECLEPLGLLVDRLGHPVVQGIEQGR